MARRNTRGRYCGTTREVTGHELPETCFTPRCRRSGRHQASAAIGDERREAEPAHSDGRDWRAASDKHPRALICRGILGWQPNDPSTARRPTAGQKNRGSAHASPDPEAGESRDMHERATAASAGWNPAAPRATAIADQ